MLLQKPNLRNLICAKIKTVTSFPSNYIYLNTEYKPLIRNTELSTHINAK